MSLLDDLAQSAAPAKSDDSLTLFVQEVTLRQKPGRGFARVVGVLHGGRDHTTIRIGEREPHLDVALELSKANLDRMVRTAKVASATDLISTRVPVVLDLGTKMAEPAPDGSFDCPEWLQETAFSTDSEDVSEVYSWDELYLVNDLLEAALHTECGTAFGFQIPNPGDPADEPGCPVCFNSTCPRCGRAYFDGYGETGDEDDAAGICDGCMDDLIARD